MASSKHQRQLKVHGGCAPRQERGEGRRRQPFLAGVGSCSLNSTWKAVQWVAAIRELAGEWSELEEVGTVELYLTEIPSSWGAWGNFFLLCWHQFHLRLTVALLTHCDHADFFFFVELPTLVKRMFQSFSAEELAQSSDAVLMPDPYLFISSSPFSVFICMLALRQYPFLLWMSPRIHANKDCTRALLVVRNFSMLS